MQNIGPRVQKRFARLGPMALGLPREQCFTEAQR